MSDERAISTTRRLAAAGTLVATAGGIASMAFHSFWGVEWPLVAFAAVVAGAGGLLASKSLVHQVFARATAHLVFWPCALAAAYSVTRGMHVDLPAAALAAGSGASLLLAHPMLGTKKAREDFAPVAFRRWFLTSATVAASGMVGSSVLAGLLGADGNLTGALGFGALAAALGASALGVLRMRAWGILGGAATSIAALVAALAIGGGEGQVIALAAIPGLMMLMPILAARLGLAGRDAHASSSTSYVRVDADDDVRFRVSADPLDEEFGDESSAPSASHARAARLSSPS